MKLKYETSEKIAETQKERARPMCNNSSNNKITNFTRYKSRMVLYSIYLFLAFI